MTTIISQRARELAEAIHDRFINDAAGTYLEPDEHDDLRKLLQQALDAHAAEVRKAALENCLASQGCCEVIEQEIRALSGEALAKDRYGQHPLATRAYAAAKWLDKNGMEKNAQLMRLLANALNQPAKETTR